MNTEYTFSKKMVILASILFLFAALFLILKSAFNVILLVLAGALMATYFRGLSFWITEKWGGLKSFHLL